MRRNRPAAIASLSNPFVKDIRRLVADKKWRQRSGKFFVEGGQVTSFAIHSEMYSVDCVVATSDFVHGSSPARAVLQEVEELGVRLVVVSESVFHALSTRDSPLGIGAVVHSADVPVSLSALSSDHTSKYIALHEVSNPGNLGTILRTADAAGISGVILVGACCEPFAPASVKASMGSLFGVQLAQCDSVLALSRWAKESRIELCAVTGSGQICVWDADWQRPLVALFGSEGAGLPPEAIEQCETSVRIPMTGTAESLNLATAVAVVSFDLTRGSF